MLEALVEVAHRPQLLLDPALLDALLESFQHGEREVALHHRVEGGLGRQHAALDGEVDALKPLRIQEARRVAEHHPAVAGQRWNAPPAAIGQRLRAVADHLAAFQQLGDERMLLELLQHVLRIDAGIAIVEAGDEAERDQVVLGAVDPGAAVLVEGERIAHGVDHFAGCDTPGRQFPQLLHADAVGLRIAVAVELESADELLGQRAARALGKNDDLGLQIVAGLEVGFLLAVLVHAFVVGAHARHAAGLEQQLGAGESGEYGDARLFNLAAQPLHEPVDRDHVVAVIAHGRRRDGELELAGRG